MDYESYQMSNSVNSHVYRSHSRGPPAPAVDDYVIQEHLDSMSAQLSSTRAQRIRAAIFPETLEDGPTEHSSPMSMPSTHFVNGQPTAVQKLAEPSQLLKNAVIDIINYKNDAEITEKALPELIRLLNDDDPIVAGQAALILHTLAKKEASRLALATPQMIQALIQAISNPRANDETRRGVSGVFSCLSQQKQGLLVIFRGASIPLLVRLLDSSNESVVNYALSTLHNLLLHIEHAKSEILRCGGCQKMVGLLTSNNPKFLAILTDSLHMLCFNNDEVKLIIESSNGPQMLLRILELTDYEKLSWTTTRLLRVLSVSSSIKSMMIANNAVQILGKELYQPISLRVQQSCLQILRNLSDQAVKLENLDSLVHLLIDLLQTNDFTTVSCAVGILSNLTCNNQYNKTAAVQANGVHGLMKTILQARDKEEILEPAICALRHITSRHSHASEAQDQVRNVNGLLPIIDLLNPTLYSWPIIKSTISLTRNLALSPSNLAVLREIGAIDKLAQLSMQTHQEYQRQQPNVELIDNYIRMDDILESCISALHIIAKDPSNRIVIRDLECIPLFVRLLYPPTTIAIQRASTGVLCELVNDRTSADMIEQQNCTQKLTELLKSSDEGIATYAAAVLFRLSDEKPYESKKNFSQENSSMNYRDDHLINNPYGIMNNPNAGAYTNPYRMSPPTIHDIPTMNFYASEGAAGSGLGSLIDNQVLLGYDRDMMQASPRSLNHHQAPGASHQSSHAAAFFDTDL